MRDVRAGTTTVFMGRGPGDEEGECDVHRWVFDSSLMLLLFVRL